MPDIWINVWIFVFKGLVIIMLLRELYEHEEHERLCKYASFSDESKGRDIP